MSSMERSPRARAIRVSAKLVKGRICRINRFWRHQRGGRQKGRFVLRPAHLCRIDFRLAITAVMVVLRSRRQIVLNGGAQVRRFRLRASPAGPRVSPAGHRHREFRQIPILKRAWSRRRRHGAWQAWQARHGFGKAGALAVFLDLVAQVRNFFRRIPAHRAVHHHTAPADSRMAPLNGGVMRRRRWGFGVLADIGVNGLADGSQ